MQQVRRPRRRGRGPCPADRRQAGERRADERRGEGHRENPRAVTKRERHVTGGGPARASGRVVGDRRGGVAARRAPAAGRRCAVAKCPSAMDLEAIFIVECGPADARTSPHPRRRRRWRSALLALVPPARRLWPVWAGHRARPARPACAARWSRRSLTYVAAQRCAGSTCCAGLGHARFRQRVPRDGHRLCGQLPAAGPGRRVPAPLPAGAARGAQRDGGVRHGDARARASTWSRCWCCSPCSCCTADPARRTRTRRRLPGGEGRRPRRWRGDGRGPRACSSSWPGTPRRSAGASRGSSAVLPERVAQLVARPGADLRRGPRGDPAAAAAAAGVAVVVPALAVDCRRASGWSPGRSTSTAPSSGRS